MDQEALNTRLADPSYEAMTEARDTLSTAIGTLYAGDAAVAREIHVAFLRYESSVLQLLQEDLGAIEQLIERVAVAESLHGTPETEKEPTDG